MNLLPLDIWRQIMAFQPWHFWGYADNDLLRLNSACNGLVVEYGWQQPDVASRADIRVAIENAEALLCTYLRYSVAPRYAEATVAWPRYLDASLARLRDVDPTGRYLSVQLPEGQIQAIGVEALTAVALATPVTLSDPDGDNYQEQFTIGPFATTVTDPAQLAVYVPASARFDGPDWSSAVGARWRIEPVTIRISGGFATITGARWLLVPPRRYQGLINIASGLDPDDATTALTTLDVYQRTTNGDGLLTSNAQATITWDTPVGMPGLVRLQLRRERPVRRQPVRPERHRERRRSGRPDQRAAGDCGAGGGGLQRDERHVVERRRRGLRRARSGHRALSGGPAARRERADAARLARDRGAAGGGRVSAADLRLRRGQPRLSRWQFDLARTAGRGR